MKKVISILLALVMVFALAACGSSSGKTSGGGSDPTPAPADGYTGGEYNLKLGHYFSAKQGTGIFMQDFADRVAELSDGKIVVDVYGESQMGGMTQLAESLHLGTIDMAAIDYVTTNSVFGHDKSILVCLPWLLEDWDHAYAMFHSDVFKEINKELLEQYDARYLGANVEGFKETFSSRAVNNAADFKDLRVRVTPNTLYLEMFNALGAQPTIVDTSEVYTALQSGIVEAYERPADSAYNNSLWEQTKYMIMTNHVIGHVGLWINETIFQSLDEQAQAILIQAGEEVTESYFASNKDNDALRLEQLVTECKQERIDIDTAELKAIMKEKVWPVLTENIDNVQEILDKIEAMN